MYAFFRKVRAEHNPSHRCLLGVLCLVKLNKLHQNTALYEVYTVLRGVQKLHLFFFKQLIEIHIRIWNTLYIRQEHKETNTH